MKHTKIFRIKKGICLGILGFPVLCVLSFFLGVTVSWYPRSLFEFSLYFMAYFLCVGVFHAGVIGVMSVLIIAWMALFRRHYMPFIKQVIFFTYLLLLSGSCASAVWSLYVFGHLYWHADYLFDFLPFLPFTEGDIDPLWGGYLIGDTTLGQLQVVWGGFTLLTWLFTLLGYFVIKKLWISSPEE